jgi:transposase
MTTMAPDPGSVTGGVDTHLDNHVAAAVNHLGRVLGTRSFPTTAAGHRRLLRWMRTFGVLLAVGVEGTGSYGSALARHLAENEVRVIEVSRPNRQVRRRHGKTDVIDAVAAARAVLSGEATATPKAHNGPVEALRLLRIVQRSATRSRTQAGNQLRAIVATAPDELRSRLRALKTAELVTTCAAFRVRAQDDGLATVTRLALRELAQRIQLPDEQLARTKTRLARITSDVAPHLAARKGVGPDTASAILVSAGDNPHRLRDERSFAALAGSNPIPASSGKTTRHRLNRGGDRQLNAALWRIAIVRLATDPDTRAYLDRRTGEGKTKSETIRRIKRYIAREIFAALPQTAAG